MDSCCTRSYCNVALIHDDVCYHIECYQSVSCLPFNVSAISISITNRPSIYGHVCMILVKPVYEEREYWSDLLPYDMSDICQEDQDCMQHEICVLYFNGKSTCECENGYSRNEFRKCVLQTNFIPNYNDSESTSQTQPEQVRTKKKPISHLFLSKKKTFFVYF